MCTLLVNRSHFGLHPRGGCCELSLLSAYCRPHLLPKESMHSPLVPVRANTHDQGDSCVSSFGSLSSNVLCHERFIPKTRITHRFYCGQKPDLILLSLPGPDFRIPHGVHLHCPVLTYVRPRLFMMVKQKTNTESARILGIRQTSKQKIKKQNKNPNPKIFHLFS